MEIDEKVVKTIGEYGFNERIRADVEIDNKLDRAGLSCRAERADQVAQGFKSAAEGAGSFAWGENAVAGAKGWYYKAVDTGLSLIWLCSEQPEWNDINPVFGTGVLGRVEPETGFEVPAEVVGQPMCFVNDCKANFGNLRVEEVLSGTVLRFSGRMVDDAGNDLNYLKPVAAPGYDDFSVFLPGMPGAGAAEGGVSRYAFAEGDRTVAAGREGHAEGKKTFVQGNYSHAEGRETSALAYISHAEGFRTKAGEYGVVGAYSHAEGQETSALGDASHAGGLKAAAKDDFSYAWNGDRSGGYSSHGVGTWNARPEGYLRGFYIDDSNFIQCVVDAVAQMDQEQKNAVAMALGLSSGALSGAYLVLDD